MLRLMQILEAQLKKQSIGQIFLIAAQSLFKNERIYIYARELDNKIDPYPNAQIDYSVTKGDLAQLDVLRNTVKQAYWEFSCNLYDGVTDCFISKHGDEIMHISWVYYRRDPNRLINLKANEAEIKYSMTLPQFRGKGIYPATLIKIQEYLREKGYKRVFICARDGNHSSVKGIEKAGFRFVKRINLVKIMGIQFSGRYVTDF